MLLPLGRYHISSRVQLIQTRDLGQLYPAIHHAGLMIGRRGNFSEPSRHAKGKYPLYGTIYLTDVGVDIPEPGQTSRARNLGLSSLSSGGGPDPELVLRGE